MNKSRIYVFMLVMLAILILAIGCSGGGGSKDKKDKKKIQEDNFCRECAALSCDKCNADDQCTKKCGCDKCGTNGTDTNGGNTSGETTFGSKITQAQAEQIALDEVPGKVKDFTIEKKFGKQTYVVEIAADTGVETDVIIDMNTGEVLGTEV